MADQAVAQSNDGIPAPATQDHTNSKRHFSIKRPFANHSNGEGPAVAQNLPALQQQEYEGGMKFHMFAAVCEFIGTTSFLFFALAGELAAIYSNPVNANNLSVPFNPTEVTLTALAFSFSWLVHVWIFWKVTYGFFNPAITLGLALSGSLSATRAVLIFIPQLAGGMVGAALVKALTTGPMLIGTRLNSISKAQGLFFEMFLTYLVVLAVLCLIADRHRATFVAPIGVGLAYFVAEMAGLFFTGASTNPVRSFGVDIANKSFEHYHWLYWVGPFLGSVMAAVFYRLIRYFEAETVVPAQDGTETNPIYLLA